MKKKKEFSKWLLVQESVLIWILSIAFLAIAFYCVYMGFTGTLPWLAAMVGCPWSAYAISQAFYYNKAKAENTTGGLKYESTLKKHSDEKVEINTNPVNKLDPAYPLDTVEHIINENPEDKCTI